MAPRHSRGFTLIELLVVIAIIGILSSVVLASLNSARQKGADAAVRSNISNARSQAELYYDANGSSGYTNICASGATAGGVQGIYQFVAGAANAAGATINVTNTVAGIYTKVTCHSNSSQWVLSAPLKSYPGMTQPMYCVDYTGKVKIADITGGGSQPASGSYLCS
jgi:prepilin-type N-terminal cleavage/methylation domain-containing protein